MFYPDIAETKPFVHIRVGILVRRSTGKWECREFPPPPENPIFLLPPHSGRQRSPRNGMAAPKKKASPGIFWGFPPSLVSPGGAAAVPKGFPWIFFPAVHGVPSHLHHFPEFSLIPFHRGLHSPALASPAAPSPGADGFPAGKGNFIQEFPLGLVFGRFLQKASLGIHEAFQCHPWEGSWASPTAGKNLWSKGISLPDHLQRWWWGK